ncbi:hypothetical protein [Pendulispora albinea]|uniref:Uncharacterized protein n=1 Tax=Pendulispora albinea TaxID=2741071 RepID=A0ABZ2M5E0_9BACT
MMGRCAVPLLALLVALHATDARADDDAGAPDAFAPAQIGGCTETLPGGGKKPVLTETFPARGLSGYAATLAVTVEHGKGETVLARGLELQSTSESAKILKGAGFTLPNQDGGAAAVLSAATTDPAAPDRAKTTLELPLIMLPQEPGRHTLTLPPLPIAVSRASGEIATVCTAPHTIVVDDPIASTPEAKPAPNPPPRVQREEWTALKRGLSYAAIGIVAGALLAYLIWRYINRPKPVPPPPPPRPAWEVAIEKLDEVRHAGLLEVGRFGEYFDRVNDVIRSYLGSRYGFDGLESTTDETLGKLSNTPLQGVSYSDIAEFLRECDLVKFANVVPTPAECARALDAGERIVRATTPHALPPPGNAPRTEAP